MTFPTPRSPADDVDDLNLFLTACTHVFDHCRDASRAQLLHGARMILAKLGGTMLLTAESTVTKRAVPEGNYVSEGMTIHVIP